MSMDEDLGRAPGPDGSEVTLRRKGDGFILLEDGRALIDSTERRSEQELVRLGLGPLRDRNDITVLLGGLGMGHVLRALLDDSRVVRVDVVEHSAPLIEWNRTHLAGLHGHALSDPRVHVHHAGFAAFLQAVREGAVAGLVEDNGGYFYAIMLDLDAGPSGLTRPDNAALYTDEGLAAMEQVLRPGGVLSLWSAQREMELISRINQRFQNVAEMVVPVELASQPDHNLDYIYRCRRRALPVEAPAPDPGSNGHAKSN